MAMNPLPPAPTRAVPATFATLADAFVSALPQFVADANALQADVTTRQNDVITRQGDVTIRQADVVSRQADVTTKQGQAASSAIAAAAAAASAANAPGTSATIAGSLTIGMGSQTFTLDQTGKAFSVGQTVVIANFAAPATQMVGVITAFNSSTGAITVSVSAQYGSGTYSGWTVALSGPQGAAALPQLQRVVRTANTILAATDSGKWFDATTGNFTQTLTAPGTLGNGWYCWYTNSSASNITFTPASGNIDGAASGTLKPGMSIMVSCDGSNFYCERIGPRVKEYLTAGTSYTTALGVRVLEATIIGGGGSGGTSSGGTNGCGGASGSVAKKTFSVSGNFAYNYTIGAGGSSVSGYSATGNAGGNTIMTVGGLTVTAYGGTGGLSVSGSSTAIVSTPVAINGDINVSGGQGCNEYTPNAYISFGGSTPFGYGTGGSTNDAGTTVAATGYGAGGFGRGSAAATGVGMPGIIILEY